MAESMLSYTAAMNLLTLCLFLYLTCRNFTKKFYQVYKNLIFADMSASNPFIDFHWQLSFKFHWANVSNKCRRMPSVVKSMQKWSNLYRLLWWLLLPLYLWLGRIWLLHQQGWLCYFRWECPVFKWWHLCRQSRKIWLHLSSRKNRYVTRSNVA